MSSHLIVAPWLLLLFLRSCTCVMLLEITLKQVQVLTFTTGLQQVSTDGNFALDFAFLAKLLIITSKQCPKSVSDNEATHVATQEVDFDNLCEIVDGRPRGIDTLIHHMRGMVFPVTEHESEELFRQYCCRGGPLSRQNGESM